jgi:PQQ-dependent dehydrogenase (methanol/ethanol family)
MRSVVGYFFLASGIVLAQSAPFAPVTNEMLLHPSPNDWLMYNRTYDSQRYSPLKQIDRTNVGQLRMVWTRGQGVGAQEGIPLVHDGVMYLMVPGAAIQALNATNGNLIWEYQRKVPDAQKIQARSKTIGIWQDMIYTTTPDSFLVALDAKTGEMRWETKTDSRGNISGAVIAGDKVISGGSCTGNHANCYISAHDAKTGKLLWKFYTAANTGEPGGDSWGDTPDDKRYTGTWGLPGTYDPTTNTVIWGVANPTPNTRMERHGGNAFAVPTSGPVDLFSDSTIAINADTGKLVWYYQHLAGDDWDEDWTNDRILASTAVNPTPATAKWFNNKLKPGEKRDVVIATGESGGVFEMDRHTGEFLWANPWPFEVPNFLISKVDPDGKVHLNEDLIFTGPNQHKVICFFNTRSYWSQAYSPVTNSLYVPWVDTCLNMQTKDAGVRPVRNGMAREGGNRDEFSGVSKINLATGKIDQIYKGPAPINGAMLATAGDLVFFGDLDRHLRALDASSGKVLWDQVIGGPVANSTITYSVNGQQYLAVATGDGLLTQSVIGYAPGINPPKGANAIYVFALPAKK